MPARERLLDCYSVERKYTAQDMRVLIAAHQFFPEHRAGTEILTLGLARTLVSHGHQAVVFAAKRASPVTNLQPGETEDYTVEGVPIRRVGRPRESLLRPYRLNYDSPLPAGRLREYIRYFRPDVVHFMHLQGLSAATIPVVKKEFGLPAVYTATDFWSVCPVVDLRRHDGVMCTGPDPSHCLRCLASRQDHSRLAGLVRRTPGVLLSAADAVTRAPLPDGPFPLRLVRDLSRRPGYIRERMNSLDRVLAPTRLTRDILVANGVDPDLVEVSHYGIDTSGLARLPREDDPPLRIGFIGTLSPHKGCDLLIKAFENLPEDAEATLEVHGPASGFEGFQPELARLAGEDRRISFEGAFPPERLGEVLAGIDILVVSSRWYENTPLVIYEAFAAGVPVVATDLGGMSEVVEHDKNGLLFPLDSVEGLARHLKRLLREPDLLGRLRDGIGPVKTVEESTREVEELYAALLDGEGVR